MRDISLDCAVVYATRRVDGRHAGKVPATPHRFLLVNAPNRTNSRYQLQHPHGNAQWACRREVVALITLLWLAREMELRSYGLEKQCGSASCDCPI